MEFPITKVKRVLIPQQETYCLSLTLERKSMNLGETALRLRIVVQKNIQVKLESSYAFHTVLCPCRYNFFRQVECKK